MEAIRAAGHYTRACAQLTQTQAPRPIWRIASAACVGFHLPGSSNGSGGPPREGAEQLARSGRGHLPGRAAETGFTAMDPPRSTVAMYDMAAPTPAHGSVPVGSGQNGHYHYSSPKLPFTVLYATRPCSCLPPTSGTLV